jgi:hypothetical protein
MLEFTCCCCHQVIPLNPKLKGNQLYCGKAECQRARKRDWKQRRIKTDEDFHQKQLGYGKKWRRGYPADQYMNKYRQAHPEYVDKNRSRQKGRNLTRRRIWENNEKLDKIVKVDALMRSSIKTNTYQMTSFRRDPLGRIVKVDTLMVEFRPIRAF